MGVGDGPARSGGAALVDWLMFDAASGIAIADLIAEVEYPVCIVRCVLADGGSGFSGRWLAVYHLGVGHRSCRNDGVGDPWALDFKAMAG